MGRSDSMLEHDGRNSVVLETQSPSARDEVLHAQDLPPRDRGRAAWTCLAAVSVISMITWGFGASQGVFREHYFKSGPFEGNQLVASIGLLVVGILQSLSPFTLKLITTYPNVRFYMMWAGMVLVVASTLGAAFAATAVQVIMTQGLMYGISSSLLFAPCISFVDEWFMGRRGLANGIFFAAPNIASAVLSPIYSLLLDKFGPRKTLIGWAVFSGAVLPLAILCVRPRCVSTGRVEIDPRHTKSSSLKLFRKPLLWLFVLSMALQSLANNIPANYLPSYATDLGVSSSNAALLVTYLSLSGVMGQPLAGALTDAIGPRVPLLLSTLVSTFAILVVWGLGKEYWTMIIVSLLFGAFAFSFMVLRSHMAAIVVDDTQNEGDQLLVSGILLMTRGLVGVASGYVAAAILQTTEDTGIKPGYGAGKWRTFIIFQGAVMAASTIGVLGMLRKRKTAA
ncbi:major facilitator superfamily domain-containing protein [Cadophora sp. MPI-SDFR-AT-0126]|nr:major facilitator superfamily domain-containing protein [Leotiomycetes sp. MPI-SDFR-AT-0126]